MTQPKRDPIVDLGPTVPSAVLEQEEDTAGNQAFF